MVSYTAESYNFRDFLNEIVHEKIRWHPCLLLSNGLAVCSSNSIQILHHLAAEFFLTIQMPTRSVQWGSEIQTSLDFEWSKRGWVEKGLDLKWNLKSRSPTIWNPDFEWSCFWMVGTIAIATAKAQPFENRTIGNQTFKRLYFKWSDFICSYINLMWYYLILKNVLVVCFCFFNT